MTSEEDFQRALDEQPDAHHLRMVFADWLEERGDPRAEGYRAVGVLRKNPQYVNGTTRLWWFCVSSPGKQFNILEGKWWFFWKELVEADFGTFVPRNRCEDAAALAFSKLPAERRRKLLAQPVST